MPHRHAVRGSPPPYQAEFTTLSDTVEPSAPSEITRGGEDLSHFRLLDPEERPRWHEPKRVQIPKV